MITTNYSRRILHEEKLAGIRKKDITFAPYDDDGRLLVLLGGLQTLAATMLASRRVLENFTTSHHLMPTVNFVDLEPGGAITASHNGRGNVR